MKKRVSSLLVAFILVISAVVFTGCDSNVDGGNEPIPMPEALKGTWTSSWGEIYIISSTTFTSKYGEDVSYAGTIVNVRDDGPGKGYITIKYTENAYYDVIGNYYIIHYKDLTSSTMQISGAADGEGKATKESAESTYSVLGGDFNYYSAVYKTGSIQKWPNKLEGTWSNDDEAFVITDETVIYQYVIPMFYGEIAKVLDEDDETGYIIFKYIENSLDSDLEGKYCVIYWENYIEGISADIAVACEDFPGDLGEESLADAESEYIDNADPYLYALIDTFDKE